MTYQQMFQEVAARYDLNWRMLAAQAYIESSFDTVALSGSGAMGLMQVMPGTWREWSPIVNVNDPFDAYSNALVAAAYLDYLRSSLSERGHPQMGWMLVAYHWGIDKLTEHLDAGLSWDALPAESRQYALDILRMAETIPAN
jgi:soluble lytic murein transglycosylase-like protein